MDEKVKIKKNNDVKRRDFFKLLGAGSAGLAVPGLLSSYNNEKPRMQNNIRETIFEKVFQTPLIDTHEHLMNEKERLQNKPRIWGRCSDWTFILNHYLDSDMRTAGMSRDEYNRFFSPGIAPLDKWKILEPYWPYIKNTGYGQAVRITINQLYGVDDLSSATVRKVQDRYNRLKKPGFYRKVLCETANIESCQVSLMPILVSEMPDLLMTDIEISGMLREPGSPMYCKPTGIEAKTLDHWHRVIDWWFNKCGKYAVGIKVANAYSRNIDFVKTPAEEVEKIYIKSINKDPVSSEEKKKLEDHVFWYAVDKGTELNLPVKLHTGYYAQWPGKPDRMPLSRVRNNPSAACDLCNRSPGTTFVFFHLSYPYYEEMLALAKQYPNAVIDMCWSWIINPIAAKDFLKKFIMTVPCNKILTFGGDYIPVEPVLGHSIIARTGMALALSELVEERWITLDESLQLTDIIMHKNARKLYNLAEKTRLLKNLNWKKVLNQG